MEVIQSYNFYDSTIFHKDQTTYSTSQIKRAVQDIKHKSFAYMKNIDKDLWSKNSNLSRALYNILDKPSAQKSQPHVKSQDTSQLLTQASLQDIA